MSADYSGTSVPTLNNSPASSWDTDAAKKSHVNDLYLVTGSGASAGNLYAFEEYAKPLVKNATPGEIVTFTDGGDNAPITSASVSLSPIQDLNGYDSPWPGGAGKNLFYFNSNPGISANGLTYTVVNENEVKITGTAVGQSTAYFWWYTNGGQGLYLKNGTYRITAEGVGGNNGPYIVYSGGGNNGVAYNTLTNAVPSRTITVTDDTKPFNYFVIRTEAGTTVDTTIKIQIESGSTATAWSPYSNICPISGHTGAELNIGATYPTADNTYSVTFTDQGTVYGGTYDFVSGKLRVTWKRIVADGVNVKTTGGYGAGGPLWLPAIILAPADYIDPSVANSGKASYLYWYYPTVQLRENSMSQGNGGHVIVLHIGSMQGTDGTHGYNSAAEVHNAVNAYLQNNPLEICYPLATPLEYTLSPQQLTTLLGQNVVWGSGTITQLTYTSNQFTPSFNWFETWTVPKITKDNGTVIVLPKPQEYTPEIYDVDAATTGRNAAGTMIRDRVARKHKFNYKFAALSQQDATEILNAVQDVSFTLTTASPETGAKTNYRVYVGDRSLPVYWMPTHATASWMYSSLSLNLIEM